MHLVMRAVGEDQLRFLVAPAPPELPLSCSHQQPSGVSPVRGTFRKRGGADVTCGRYVHEHVVASTLEGEAEGASVISDRRQPDLSLPLLTDAGRLALAVEPHGPEDAP